MARPKKPQTAKEYLLRGAEHLENGDYDMAITEFDAAIRLNPGCAEGAAAS